MPKVRDPIEDGLDLPSIYDREEDEPDWPEAPALPARRQRPQLPSGAGGSWRALVALARLDQRRRALPASLDAGVARLLLLEAAAGLAAVEDRPVGAGAIARALSDSLFGAPSAEISASLRGHGLLERLERRTPAELLDPDDPRGLAPTLGLEAAELGRCLADPLPEEPIAAAATALRRLDVELAGEPLARLAASAAAGACLGLAGLGSPALLLAAFAGRAGSFRPAAIDGPERLAATLEAAAGAWHGRLSRAEAWWSALERLPLRRGDRRGDLLRLAASDLLVSAPEAAARLGMTAIATAASLGRLEEAGWLRLLTRRRRYRVWLPSWASELA
ncbi:hypothetical protein SAMN06265365_110124 [Tistlia consotensis]|uniref:Uncharacterized protein n=1 Tax=Tistlia consotensis USBA 355 TaxID=560819 RepID=A0A1Y6BT12_9PROT|nr:hypothetical protein [Tistlia consotensis]SMF26871.1 hypothetical protein SAMN05428998_10932 [Tistlia consotensis USBA 355]SNR66802.1 hypothetical protein SAMN06265365_110124 [Tistlia consotensis]